jgi:hypothetical protein
MLHDNPSIHAYSIAELAERGPVGKSTLYAEIATGRLIARKIGRRTIILADDWRAFLAGAPPITPTAPAAALVPAPATGRRPRGRPRKVPVASPAERVPLADTAGADRPPPGPPPEMRPGSPDKEPERRSKKSGKFSEREAGR